MAKTEAKAETPVVRIKHAGDLKAGEEEFSGYCMKCRKKLANVRGQYTETKNGRAMLRGVHPRCGTAVVKITKARPKTTTKKKAS